MIGAVFCACVLGCRSIGLLSIGDTHKITALVRAETKENILSLVPQRDGTVEVLTGVQRGTLDGRGRIFLLRRTSEGWKVIKRGSWVS